MYNLGDIRKMLGLMFSESYQVYDFLSWLVGFKADPKLLRGPKIRIHWMWSISQHIPTSWWMYLNWMNRGWGWCPDRWGFVSHHQTKYLLEMKYPQELGDVKHWDINPNPWWMFPPGVVLLVEKPSRRNQKHWQHWPARPHSRNSCSFVEWKNHPASSNIWENHGIRIGILWINIGPLTTIQQIGFTTWVKPLGGMGHQQRSATNMGWFILAAPQFECEPSGK